MNDLQATNGIHLPEYEVMGCKTTDDEMHFQVEAPAPIACEGCGIQGEFVRFGKRDVPYRDLPNELYLSAIAAS